MPKILIVDDEPMMLMVTKKILSEKYEVLCAGSAREALDRFEKEEVDLVLTDLFMPEMTGFEMHKVLQEKHSGRIPVVYMTSDETDEAEQRGFDLGAADFIRKPFRADVLLRRVDNILKNREIIRDLTEEATMDKLTGLLNKAGATESFTRACNTDDGVFMIVDLDSFKLVNDLYGHDNGDAILKCFASVIRNALSKEDIAGRIGGDEFGVFMKGKTEDTVAEFTKRVNADFLAGAVEILGPDMNIPLGVSVGAVAVPDFGRSYEELFRLADQVLYKVKQNGKHTYAFYAPEQKSEQSGTDPREDMRKLTMVLSERNIVNGAQWLGQDAFTGVWRFLVRFVSRYNVIAHKVIFTLVPQEAIEPDVFGKIAQGFGEHICAHLRKSDLVMQSRSDQFFVILPELNEIFVEPVIQRIVSSYRNTEDGSKVKILYWSEPLKGEEEA